MNPTHSLVPVLVIAAVGLATYALRVSLLLLPRSPWPPRFDRVLRRIPAAILPVLVVKTLLPDDFAEASIDRLIPAAVAMVIAWRTRNIAATLGGGMLALWLMAACT